MKACAINPNRFEGLHRYRKESSFFHQISAIDPKTGREVICARFYGPGSVIYCCLWVRGNNLYASGAGKAGGYGYHKSSAALSEAIRCAGFDLSKSIHGVGDTAMRDAIEALARCVTGKRKFHIVRAHA